MHDLESSCGWMGVFSDSEYSWRQSFLDLIEFTILSMSYMIPYFTKWMRQVRRHKTNPQPCLISMKLSMWPLGYLNNKCSKFDWDRFRSFWDIASQSQKSGVRLFKEARLFGKIRYVMWNEHGWCYHVNNGMTDDQAIVAFIWLEWHVVKLYKFNSCVEYWCLVVRTQ